jgi:AcrR family transcriptional regulator
MAVRKRHAKNRVDGDLTRNAILDHAERLFSIDGYTGVSVRQVTAAAHVDAAMINYHFGTKEKLFHTVLIRRVDAMSRARVDKLAAMEIKPDDPATIARLLDAFLVPIIGTTPDEVRELKNYRALVALVANSKTWQDVVFKEHYDPVARMYIEALCKALPRASKAEVCWAFSFFLGSMVNALAETGRIERLSDNECRSSDLAEAHRQLIQFAVGGFLNLGRKPDAAARRARVPRRRKAN